jgi:hypothetical protein
MKKMGKLDKEPGRGCQAGQVVNNRSLVVGFNSQSNGAGPDPLAARSQMGTWTQGFWLHHAGRVNEAEVNFVLCSLG